MRTMMLLITQGSEFNWWCTLPPSLWCCSWWEFKPNLLKMIENESLMMSTSFLYVKSKWWPRVFNKFFRLTPRTPSKMFLHVFACFYIYYHILSYISFFNIFFSFFAFFISKYLFFAFFISKYLFFAFFISTYLFGNLTDLNHTHSG